MTRIRSMLTPPIKTDTTQEQLETEVMNEFKEYNPMCKITHLELSPSHNIKQLKQF